VRRSAALLLAASLLAAALDGQGAGATAASRQDAVQAALNKQAIVAAERQGTLHLRDLARCGVATAGAEELGIALFRAIAEWVESHPPQMYSTYEPDFRAILQLPTWSDALERVASPEARTAWDTLYARRGQRVVAATAGFLRAFAACEFRLTPAQTAALEPLCRRIAEQAVELDVVRAQPGRLVRDMDRRGTRVLTAVQSEYPEQLTARGGARDAIAELDLECERIRLVCGLDEERARLLRACGRSEARKLIADLQARAKAESESPPEPEARPRPVHNGLPNEEYLAAPFWAKVRDTLLTAAERAELGAAPPADLSALAAARVELALARMGELFHLDAEQEAALRPLAEKVVDQDMTSTRVASLDVTRGFGMQFDRQETSPEERAVRRALEDVLDPDQFEVLRDRTGL
jgi:hypothetical protein